MNIEQLWSVTKNLIHQLVPMTLQCSQILLFQTIITRMSDSLSPSGSDLIIDDEDLDSVSVTKEDLSEAEPSVVLPLVEEFLLDQDSSF